MPSAGSGAVIQRARPITWSSWNRRMVWTKGSAALAETLGSHSGCGMFRPWVYVLGQSEQSQGVALDDSSQRLARDHRQVGALGDLVDAVESLDALGDAGVGEVAAEKEFVDDLVLVGRHQGVVRLPGALQQPRDVR